MSNCPACGADNAYLGFATIECDNPNCSNYVSRADASSPPPASTASASSDQREQDIAAMSVVVRTLEQAMLNDIDVHVFAKQMIAMCSPAIVAEAIRDGVPPFKDMIETVNRESVLTTASGDVWLHKLFAACSLLVGSPQTDGFACPDCPTMLTRRQIGTDGLPPIWSCQTCTQDYLENQLEKNKPHHGRCRRARPPMTCDLEDDPDVVLDSSDHRCKIGYKFTARESQLIRDTVQRCVQTSLTNARRYPTPDEVTKELALLKFTASCHRCGMSLEFEAIAEDFTIAGVNAPAAF